MNEIELYRSIFGRKCTAKAVIYVVNFESFLNDFQKIHLVIDFIIKNITKPDQKNDIPLFIICINIVNILHSNSIVVYTPSLWHLYLIGKNKLSVQVMTAKYEQIKAFILEKIESGAWHENDLVPSENQLANDFSVSRMTARKALEELRSQGILLRTKGSGTYVGSLKAQGSMFEIRDIADEIKERGHKYEAVLIEFGEIEAIPPIAIALGVEIGSQVFHSVIVHNENGKPVQVEERFVNKELIPEYLQQDFNQQSPHEYLSQVAPLTEARHTIEAVAPTEQVCEWLQLFNEEPCLQLIRRTLSKHGVVCFARIIYPGSSYRLGGQLTFNKKK